MSAPWQNDEHVVDLLVQDATEGLDPSAQAELLELLELLGADAQDARRQIDAAAAAIAVAGATREAMPAGLRARLQALDPIAPRVPATVTPLPQRAAPASKRSSAGPAPAWWAAAACLVLAVSGWWPRIFRPEPAALAAPPVASVAAARASLAARSGTVQLSWTRGPDAAAAALTGDVVFDPATQRGYLRFRDLPPNDRAQGQYQLWIVDATRSQPEPIDGGVFDIPAANAQGDVIIPFQPRLNIGQAAAFVITFERPGGVVISRQERVLALAKA